MTSGYGTGLYIRGEFEWPLKLMGVTPTFSYGNPSIAEESAAILRTLLAHNWSWDPSYPSYWMNDYPNMSLAGQESASEVEIAHWDYYPMIYQVGLGPTVALGAGVSLPQPVSITAQAPIWSVAGPTYGFSAQSCEEVWHSNKWHARWTLTWSGEQVGPSEMWQVVESQAETPFGGVLLGQGTGDTTIVLTDYPTYGGSAVRFYFLKIGDYPWQPLSSNPLDLAACAA